LQPFAHYSRTSQSRSDPKEILGHQCVWLPSLKALPGRFMATYLLEVTAKVVVHSDEDSIEDFLANTYSRIAEFVPDDEHIVDLELDAFPLPQETGGSPDFGDGADPQEGGKAPVP
jgi:hypothetical protein